MENFDRAINMGHANKEAIELTRRHCRHARIELVSGRSMLGEMVNLPIGIMEVRCQNAALPRTQSLDALELALEFYETNCRHCPHRDATGELPNLATVADERVQEVSRRRAAEQRLADERQRRYSDRRERRRRLLAGDGPVVEDLGKAVDLIDRAEPRVGAPNDDEARAIRHILDAANVAPDLFTPVLVETLMELAMDVGDPTALGALGALVRAGRCAPRPTIDVARAVLLRDRSLEAGRLLVALEAEVQHGDLTDLVDQLIDLASGQEGYSLWSVPFDTAPLIVASRIDPATVTEKVIAHLNSGNDRSRESGADAARVLIQQDSNWIKGLGRPLVQSVRGPDRGYAGEPRPATSALAALAEAWRSDPDGIQRLIEDIASHADEATKDELARLPDFVLQDPDVSLPATTSAVEFAVQRATADWGEAAADHAAIQLHDLARDCPAAVSPHVNSILGVILSLSDPTRDRNVLAASSRASQALEAMQQEDLRIKRDARRRRLAGAVGRCAAVEPSNVLTAVHQLFAATTGDEQIERTVRITMVDALTQAVSPETLRDILPLTYTALLDGDQAVRAAGIGLWAACSRVATALPAELTVLARPLLEDSYVVVHQRMLDNLPDLDLPPELAPELLRIVGRWVQTYAAANPAKPHALYVAITALRYLAGQLEDESAVTGWYGLALAHLDGCSVSDRERLLTSWWPDQLLGDPAWVELALDTAASPELVDYYNQRHEPLLRALMDRPQRLADVPLSAIEPLSALHGQYFWRALEPVELLQSAGRWADATTIAKTVEGRQVPGKEGELGRRVTDLVARVAELAAALSEGPPPLDRLATVVSAMTRASRELEESFPQGVGAHLQMLLDLATATATAAEILLTPDAKDPGAAATRLDQMASLLAGMPATHASGAQRQWVAQSWKIAAALLRYDEHIRRASADALLHLQAARRMAKVLTTEIASNEGQPAPAGLGDFLAVVTTVEDPDAAQRAWQQLGGIPSPISLVGTSLVPRSFKPEQRSPKETEDPPRAVCVATMHGVPVTDVLVLRRNEVYHLGMNVRLLSLPDWAVKCVIEPVAAAGRDALALPRYEFNVTEGVTDEFGVTLSGEGPLHCAVEQPIHGPALDCPLQVHLVGDGHDEVIEVAGLQRLSIRAFDPSRDSLTQHEQTDARLLAMFARLNSADFDREDVRAFCRLFSACVRAAQMIMFDKTFKRGTQVSEKQFHDELERHLRADPELEGRLSRRDAVAGGFDDLLHDDIIAELKVSRGTAVTVDECVSYLGQPTQYGVGRGSQLSILVVLDHGRKEAPPGVMENYIDWLKPALHGLPDPRYPSLVGVLIVNTNLPVPSAWSRRRISGQRWPVTADDGSPDAV